MKRWTIPISCLTMAWVCIFADSARAVTFSYTENLSTVPTSSGPQVPNSGSGVFYPVGSLVNVFRSPFENTSQFGTATYTSVEAGGSATYNFSPSNTLSIFWGSPDSWNTLSIFSGLDGTGKELYSITGNPLLVHSVGHDLVKFVESGGLFSSVVLSSSLPAFEFSNLAASNVSPTPLPPAYWQFIAGMVVIGLLVRSRKRQPAGIV